MVFQPSITTVPKEIVNKLEKTLSQKKLWTSLKIHKRLWETSTPKIKHETVSNDHKAWGLENVDIPNKIIAIQCSWIRKLYDNFFHDWKLIPLYLIEKLFYISFKLHSNLLFISKSTKFFPSSYREIIMNWKKHLAMIIEIPSWILSQCLWYNKSIQMDKTFSIFWKILLNKLSRVPKCLSALSARMFECPKRPSALRVPYECPSAQVSFESPSAWVPSRSPPSVKRNFRLTLSLTLNRKHSSEMLFKLLIIRF